MKEWSRTWTRRCNI